MKRMKKIIALFLCTLTAAVMLFAAEAFAADEFEQSLSAFPKSYRASLRELHEKHPNWTFNAFKTGLDWNTAVSIEQAGGRSLFPNAYAGVFKSVENGDYDYSKGSYIQKDYGFVTANKLAVAYYMDPRNFLNENGIFQFEDLSYDESFDEAAVEFVLRGTFMYNTKISYYNTKGKLIKTNEKYSTVICEAGRRANINPCYLASKIRGEIGNGTSATSGKNETYPGIYNFYNIGASDGAGAIERGLKWAKSGKTYSRPWTSPKKSIIGGAEFVAESYIAKGQFTAYLQKFNVNPDSAYGVYNHQYMTNVCAGAIQAYFSYDSYYSAKLLDNKFVFSIPVFNDMDDQNGTDGKIMLTGSDNLSGYINVSGGINVRKGPSTNNEKVLTKYLPQNTKVTVLDTVKTDSSYYANVLSYPFWYKIKFSFESKSYTGYVPKSFVTITSAIGVRPGAYKPSFSSNSGKKLLHLVSYDARVAEIDGDVINFLKNGTTEIGAYDSTGRFCVLRYTVYDDGAPAAVIDLFQSEIASDSLTLSWRKSANATGYTVYRLNEKTKKYEKIKTLRGTSLKIGSLSPGHVGTYAVRARKKIDETLVWADFSSPVTASTLPPQVKSVSQRKTSVSGYTLTWERVKGATGYVVYRYDSEKKRYVWFKSTSANSMEITGLKAGRSAKYKVRAFVRLSNELHFAEYSPVFEAVTTPPAVKNVKAKRSGSYCTLTWSKAKNADGYRVYKLNKKTGEYARVKTVKNNRIKIKAAKKTVFAVRAYTKGVNTYYGAFSSPVTVK